MKLNTLETLEIYEHEISDKYSILNGQADIINSILFAPVKLIICKNLVRITNTES